MNEYLSRNAPDALTLIRPTGTSGPRVNPPPSQSRLIRPWALVRGTLLGGWLAFGGLAAGVSLPAASSPEKPALSADAGWELLAGYLFRDAYEMFERLPAKGDRERALGEAASLLNHPPVTPGKVEQAEAQLRQLVADGATDDTALYARYLLARIAHNHRPAEVAEIETAYRAVIAAAPAHPIAQVAAGKLALVFLYQRPDLTVTERLTAATALEPVATAAQLPEAACAYYRAIAGAALYYNVLNAQVLHWLLRADEIGTVDMMAASGLRIQIAETARALDRRDVALTYYQRFLDNILPTDGRYRTARERMVELEAMP